MATTASSQEVISTAENLFEGFAADNYNFLDTDELFDWLRCVFKDYDDEPLPEWFNLISRPALIERLTDKIIDVDDNTEDIISDYVYNLSDIEVSFLYYKNNIFEFIKDHEYVQDIIYDIFSSVINLDYVDEDDDNWFKNVPDEYKDKFVSKKPKDYNKFVNKMYFMDPNDAPDNIIGNLNELRDIMMKYIYVNYMSFDRIYRLRNFKRSVVTVIDTDSNILSLDLLMNLIFNTIVKDETFGRDHVNNVFIGINIITYVLTEAIKEMLYTFSVEANISEEFRRKYAMKNEFFFLRLVIGDTKKRYLSRITLREGNYLNPPKYDIKGFDFKKSTCSEFSEKFYDGVIKKYILVDNEIDVEAIIKEINKFRQDVIQKIKDSDTSFLPNASPKEIEAYADPSSEQSIRGVYAWNFIYPNNMIELPSKVSMLKLNIFKESDIEDLKDKEPEIYNTIIEKIFNDTTGIFVTNKKDNEIKKLKMKDKWWNDLPKKYKAKYKKLGLDAWNEFVDSYEGDEDTEVFTKSRGMQVLAIPQTEKIPEWVLPYIDYTTIVDNILSPFMPVLEIFKSKQITVGKSIGGVNRKTEGFSNIIKI